MLDSCQAAAMQRMKIFVRRTPTGELRSTWLVEEGGALGVVEETEQGEPVPLPLPGRALEVAFARYARPMDVAVPPSGADQEPLTAGAGLVRAFRFRGWGDVEPSDYLLYETPGAEPVAAPASLLAAALVALGRAAQR